MIFYTNRFIPEKFAACTRGPFIFIRPQYKGDRGLLEHEKTHRWQWLRTFGIHSFMYLLFPKYKLACEVEAYKKQAKFYQDNRLPLFAIFIAIKYGLNITEEEALKLLTEL